MLLGIDGGGTKTRLFIQRGEEEPEYFEFPISLKVKDADWAAPAEKLRTIITQTLGFDAASKNLSIAIGLSGMSSPEDQESFRVAILAQTELSCARVHIESDATLTLKTVLAEGEEGILVIAGTGSVVFYQPSGQSARRIGGWGPVLSDDGSGYRIGLRALRYYINVLDGVFPRDAFSKAMEARMEGMERTPKSLTERARNDPAFVAAFAQDAFETADNLKPVQDLIHEELIDLVTLLFPLFFAGVMSEEKPYALYLAGSVAWHPRMLKIIEHAFEEGDVDVRIVDERAAAYKALEMAKTL